MGPYGQYGRRMGPNGKAGGQGMQRLRGLMGTGDLAAWRHGATAGQEKWKEERRVRERQMMKDMKVLHLAARRHGAAARAGWVEKEVGDWRHGANGKDLEGLARATMGPRPREEGGSGWVFELAWRQSSTMPR